MTETSPPAEPQPGAPAAGADRGSSPDSAAQTSSTTLMMLGFGGYLILPFLALFTVTLGFVLVLNDRIVPGLGFLFVAQIWVAIGLWAHLKRRRLLQDIKEARQTPNPDAVTPPV